MTEAETPAVPAGEVVTPEVEIEVAEAPAAEVEPEGEQTEEQKAEKSRSQERREQRRREMERLRESEALAIAENRRLEAELARVRQSQQAMQPPRQTDYPDQPTYQAALTAYMATQMLDNRQQADLQRQAREAAAQAEMVRASQHQMNEAAFAAQQTEARRELPDYDAVVGNPSLPITPAMAEVIKAADQGARIAYYLGKNPQAAAQIAGLPPVQMALALGRIEAAVSAPRTAPPVTNAPAPISPVRPKATAATDPLKMSHSEFVKWRDAGGTF